MAARGAAPGRPGRASQARGGPATYRALAAGRPSRARCWAGRRVRRAAARTGSWSLMVLVLVTGAVVEEDGSAWVWGRREGRHAPWAASSAALGVAILRGMNHYQGGCDPFIALGSWRRPRRVVRLCAQDGAVRGHRPWWAVWVWRWAVAVTFGVAALGVAVLRGMNYYQGGCDPFFALGSWRRPRRAHTADICGPSFNTTYLLKHLPKPKKTLPYLEIRILPVNPRAC